MAAKAVKTSIKAGRLARSFSFERSAINTEKRTVELAFSSEAPYRRWFGVEILSHEAGACDLTRLQSGTHPLLLEHDPRRQIGVIETASIGADKKGRATVRFTPKGINPEADQVFAEVEAGIRSLVSVGYQINRLKMDEVEGDPNEGDAEETYRATSWTPYEISIVAIPADDTVGVGRSDNNPEAYEIPIEISESMKRSLLLDPAANGTGGGGTPAPAAPAAPAPAAPNIADARNSEKNRVREILALGTRFRKVAEANEAIEKDLSVDAFRKQIMDTMTEEPGDSTRTPEGQSQRVRSLGDALVESREYAEAVQFFKSGGQGSRSLEVNAVLTRATLTTTVSGLTAYERPPGIVLVEQQQLLVAELFAPGTTNQTTVRYMREDTFTNAATALAEEGTYAEASWDLSEQDSAVKKIGVLGRVTDEMFEDSAAIQSYVNARIPFMVLAKEDQHCITGTGSSNQLTGILNVSGIQTEAAGASSLIADAIHKAITKVRSVGFYEPDAIVMHPTDWELIALTKDSNGQYYGGGPILGAYGMGSYSNVKNLWGLPVVITTAITSGTALVGAFRLGAQLFRRRGINIQTTNSDASDFANGRIAIRADVRDALAVYRPSAFCQVTEIA